MADWREDNKSRTAKSQLGAAPSIQKFATANARLATQQCARRLGLTAHEFELLQIIYTLCMDAGDVRECILIIFSQAFEIVDEPESRSRLLEAESGREISIFAKRKSKFRRDQIATKEMSMHHILRLLIPLVLAAAEGTTEPWFNQLNDELNNAFPTNNQHPHINEIAHIIDNIGVPHTVLDRHKFDQSFLDFMGNLSLPRIETTPMNFSYLVIGWFPRGSMDPREKFLNLKFAGDRIRPKASMFGEIRKAARWIRGYREFFSLKSLRAFGLYECDLLKGTHLKVQLTDEEKRTLSLFMTAYKASHRHPDRGIDEAWTTWVEKYLNQNKKAPCEGRYSLELIYGWSPVRLTVAVTTPTLFSFLVGLVYMIVTDDVSTAWTISSYIVTAAGAIVALLGILGTLKEG